MDMTPDELDAIRDRHRNLKDYGPINAAVDDVGALLVVVDRMLALADEWDDVEVADEWHAADRWSDAADDLRSVVHGEA